jgi:hypothetical protein
LTRKQSFEKELKILKEGWWIEHMTTRPGFARAFSNAQMSSAVLLSKPLVGSSRRRTRGGGRDGTGGGQGV